MTWIASKHENHLDAPNHRSHFVGTEFFFTDSAIWNKVVPGNKPLHLETLAAPMQIKKHHQLFLINHFIVFVCLFIIIDRSSAMGNEMQQLPFVGCEKMHRKNWKVEVISIRFEYYRCVDAFTIDATCSFEVDIAFQHFLWTIDVETLEPNNAWHDFFLLRCRQTWNDSRSLYDG